LGDLCLPPVKPRWADLTDAGPGVGVSNYEVRFRDAELARVHNSDYRSPDELFFFNSVYLDNYRGASERNKEQAPGAAYFRKIESFMEDHYIRGELLWNSVVMPVKSQEKKVPISVPETERIPQPVPDSNNPGHFMDIYQTESTGRTPDDYLPRKCIKDLYEEHSDSIRNDQDTMKSFCSKYNVEEKHVIAYVNHLKDIEIRKDIRTRAAQERRRQEAERTYKDFQWDNLIEGGKVEKLRVRELDLYLNKHGLTTVGRKLDKVKAIRCHYYRQNK
ncbi:unnamed protein product, partial [Pocillopora meandrina]